MTKTTDSTDFSRNKNAYIIYEKNDLSTAHIIAKELSNHKFNTWYRNEDLLPGENTHLRINQEIESAACAIVLLSKKSVKSRGIFQIELRAAVANSTTLAEGTPFIIPLVIEPDVPIPKSLNDIANLDLHHDFERGVNRLIKTLQYIFKTDQTENSISTNDNKHSNQIISDTEKTRKEYLCQSLNRVLNNLTAQQVALIEAISTETNALNKSKMEQTLHNLKNEIFQKKQEIKLEGCE